MRRLTCVTLTPFALVLSFCLHLLQPGVAAEAPKAKVEVKIADWKQTQKMVAAHKGKIVVLDAWSTTCAPCVKEFPNLVALHKKYGGKDVVCMSMSCDYAGIKNKPPEFYRERVITFLEKQGATFENILSSVPSDELFEEMELASIPAVYVYGRDGKLVKRFDNEKAEKEEDNFTYEHVNKLVAELAAKK
jgi:thiol-disulfide isomerase/thioredoxin